MIYKIAYSIKCLRSFLSHGNLLIKNSEFSTTLIPFRSRMYEKKFYSSKIIFFRVSHDRINGLFIIFKNFLIVILWNMGVNKNSIKYIFISIRSEQTFFFMFLLEMLTLPHSFIVHANFNIFMVVSGYFFPE